MADDRQRTGEAGEHFVVAVAEDHESAVEERVVVVPAVVDAGHERHSRAVERIASEHLGEQRIRSAEPVIGFVDRLILDGFFALGADEFAGQHLGVLCIVDEALQSCRGGGGER